MYKKQPVLEQTLRSALRFLFSPSEGRQFQPCLATQSLLLTQERAGEHRFTHLGIPVIDPHVLHTWGEQEARRGVQYIAGESRRCNTPVCPASFYEREQRRPGMGMQRSGQSSA